MAEASVRVLGPADAEGLKAFLVARADSSLILLSNLSSAGLADDGAPYSGLYVGAFEGEALTGVVAHYWNNVLVFQAGGLAVELAEAARAATRRSVAGLVGPWEQVSAAYAVGFGPGEAGKHAEEALYALPLDRLVLPPLLATGAAHVRRAKAEEANLLARWRSAYRVEAIREQPSAALDASAAEDIARLISEGSACVLDVSGAATAFCAFNARHEDVVQVGGVWTPPEARGRGLARAAVAGQLAIARAEGARRAVLFTELGNLPARRAYESIGFERIGSYGMIIFGDRA